MKAAVCYEFGQPLVVENIDIDEPRSGEVKVRIGAVAICHSDVHLIRGEWGGATPVVAGHEAAGVVEAVGENVTLARPGDRVAVSLLRSCGRCFYCTTGSPYFCNGLFALAQESRLRTAQGQTIHQGISTGAFAEYAVVDQSQVMQVPDDLPLDRAALLACGVITGVGAAVNTAQMRPGSSVVVVGVGGVGLNAVQGAVLCGAETIIAVDVNDAKLAAARSFGATHAFHAGRADLRDAVAELTGGRGADYVLVTVGSPSAVESGVQLARQEGTVVVVGIPARGATIPLSVYGLVIHGTRILGCNMGSTRLRIDIPRLVGLYRQGRLKLDELITARYPLERINDAVESMERGEALRNVVVLEPNE